MTPTAWVTDFMQRFKAEQEFSNVKPITQEDNTSRREWTNLMTSLIHSMGNYHGFYCYCKKGELFNGSKPEKEQLTIDFLWIDKREDEATKWKSSEIIGSYKPIVAIEHESYARKNTNLKNVIGSFWKVMAVRADLHVMIAYFKDREEQTKIIRCLTQMLIYTSLGEDPGNVIVLLGQCDEINKCRSYEVRQWKRCSWYLWNDEDKVFVPCHTRPI